MEGDSEDEWFLDSITRYKQLIMFDTGDPIIQLELCNLETMCILTERSNGQKFVSVLSLPAKIRQTYLGSSEIQQSNDLKIKTGIFPMSPPSQIKAVYGKDILLMTQDDACGLMVYSIKVADTDQVTFSKKLNFSLTSPNIALINESTVVLTKDTKQKTLVCNLDSGETLADFICDHTQPYSLIPVCLEEKIIALTEKFNGISHMYDWKNSAVIGKINVGEEWDAAMFPSSGYSYVERTNLSSHIYFLSQTGILKVYDLRNFSKPLIRHDMKLSTIREYLKLNIKPNNSNIISVSGFDSNVYLYDTSKNMTEIFKHDGHARTEECVKDTVVTDHLWYPDEFVISAALNNSINCWVADSINR